MMQASSASRNLSREAFLNQLRESKLLSDSAVAALAASAAYPDGAALAESLLTTGVFTAFQVEAIVEGRFGDLRIGGYEVLECVGTGGMGTVYKACHRRMKRIVAIKVLQPNLGADVSFFKRFQREVVTAARLNHPHVVMAHDAGEADGAHFLVMEYINGCDLETIVRRQGPFPVREAVQAILQAARGLEYAHGQQVIHRDIKPANLLRDENGVVKVADLGLARFNIDRGAASALTDVGVILGTADYMSPEQAAEAVTVDHRTDIYSLGCSLYFLLTGQALYAANGLVELMLKHRAAPIPSARLLRSEVPVALDQLIRKMVAKAPVDRHQSMTEVVQKLEEIAAQLDQASPEPAPLPKSGNGAAGASPGSSPQAVAVVLAEPSRTQAAIIRKYFQQLGIEPLAIVPSGQEVLDVLGKQLPGVIVAALHLKDMTGLQLAQQTQAAHGARSPRFLLISSASESHDVATLCAASHVALLLKPFTLEQLREGLRRVASLRGSSAALATASNETLCRTGPALPKPAPAPSRREPLRVLLADEAPAARARMREVLQAEGFTKFDEVGEAAATVAALRRGRYDFVVLTDHIPALDAGALINFLRRHAPATVPILVVASEASTHVPEALQSQGVAVLRDARFPADAVKEVLSRFFP